MNAELKIRGRAHRHTAERFEMQATDSVSISCIKWSRPQAVRGVVQIAHGLGEHIGRYAELADILVRDEFVVYGNDSRGHGLTAKSSGRFGDFGPGGFDALVQDMVSLRVLAKSEHPGKPYILLGQGMGSFAAQQFILDHSHSIDGLVLSGSGTLDGLARLGQNLSAPDDWMKVLNAGIQPARTQFDWLSRDKSEVDAFVNDPLCFGSLKPESMQSFLDAFPRLADPLQLRDIRRDLPIYMFSGSDDPVGQKLQGASTLADRYRSAGVTSITHDFYPGGRHEMLHELNQGEVITNLLVWMAGILGQKPA